MRRALILLAGIVALTACANSSSTADTPSFATMVASDASRPFTLFTPSSYRDDTPMPLVILLHGLGRSGEIVEAYFQLQPLAESRGFLYVHPDGTPHPAGDRFWDATDACCGLGSTADDVTYLTSIIDQVSATRNVDPSRVYVMGHSNGGFMSYRMACDAAERIAAIASVAGATWADTSKCNPSEPVSVLQVHGTADVAVKYDGRDPARHRRVSGCRHLGGHVGGLRRLPRSFARHRGHSRPRLGAARRGDCADACRWLPRRHWAGAVDSAGWQPQP